MAKTKLGKISSYRTKIVLFLLFILILLNTVSAYVKPIKYNNISIKLYSDKLNINETKHLIDITNEKYLSNIKYVKVYSFDFCLKYLQFWGRYFWNSKTIEICDNNIDTWAHELAHNMQKENGEMLKDAMLHTGNFCKYNSEILESLNITNYLIYCGVEK